jgi:3-hydroxyisobutyrate dehydrogenase-like beta-hydroxyacid dehydrogenase
MQGDKDMDSATLRLGFLGFGEAGYHFGKGLTAAGLRGIAAFSPSGANAAPGDAIRTRAAEAGVELVASPKELCARANVIMSLVPGKTALAALRAIRPHLGASHLYVDATTNSVKAMEKAAALIADRAGFADAAIMGSIPLGGIKTPIVVSGSHAEAFRAALAPFGMVIQVVGDKPGAASAMKLIRSVCMKGIAAVLLESLEAAQRAGLLDYVPADLAASIDERPFEQIIKRYVCGSAVHAGRRVHEMTDCLELLRTLHSSNSMTRATRAKLASLEAMGLRERFGGREPDSIVPVMEAIAGAKR